MWVTQVVHNMSNKVKHSVVVTSNERRPLPIVWFAVCVVLQDGGGVVEVTVVSPEVETVSAERRGVGGDVEGEE